MGKYEDFAEKINCLTPEEFQEVLTAISENMSLIFDMEEVA